MADHPSKTRWEAENVIKVGLKINRNQDPELFELLTKAENKAGIIRELLRAGLTTLQHSDVVSPMINALRSAEWTDEEISDHIIGISHHN